jgi:hypothetical protein
MNCLKQGVEKFTLISTNLLIRFGIRRKYLRSGRSRSLSTTDHIFRIRQILKKKKKNNKTVPRLIIDFKKACDSIRREISYNIVSEFGILTKLTRLIKMCPNETYSRVRLGKHLSDMFPFSYISKQGDFYRHCFSNLL